MVPLAEAPLKCRPPSLLPGAKVNLRLFDQHKYLRTHTHTHTHTHKTQARRRTRLTQRGVYIASAFLTEQSSLTTMATGVLRNFQLRLASPVYFHPEEEDEDEEEEEEKGSSDQDEEEDSSDPRVSSDPQDATERLLRFADIISRDVRRYFGRREAQVVSGEGAAAAAVGGRPRYDDPPGPAGEVREGTPKAVDKGHPSSELGPLAELFESRGKDQGRPMNARHLPLSFWTEPDPYDGDASPQDTHMNYSLHTLENSQPDFSDLLANWDPNPDDANVLH
ncbi:protein PERCC1 [Hippocampus zosterae]|uniref:protein PERCC1 n=1 Tax=Hippocampus zosterae TaxID=109293 RepID=UPI00223D041E|nr:protein PERCC1 [Hippocampus zosterae]